jgi:hypothetical protein
MRDLGLPCGKLDCPCSGALKPLGEDVSALRRLGARRATVSDSVYSLDRVREATIQMRSCWQPDHLRQRQDVLNESGLQPGEIDFSLADVPLDFTSKSDVADIDGLILKEDLAAVWKAPQS